MGFATHLGPWLLGTVKNTTGTTAGTIRNTGCTVVSQQKAITYSDTAASQAFVLPAGSVIVSAKLIVTTAFAGTGSPASTIALLSNGTAINTAQTITIGATGDIVLTLGNNNATGAGLVANVGTTDAIITYTFANTTITAGAATLVVNYAVRNSDGGQFQTTFNN